MTNEHLKINPFKRINESLTNDFHDLVGGHGEYLKLIDWQKNSSNINEVKDFKASLRTNSELKMLFALAKMAYKYDEIMGYERRQLNNNLINTILKDKRSIAAIANEENPDTEFSDGEKEKVCKFAYTIGNCLQDPAVPELLTFYPHRRTIGHILNSVSDYLLNEIIKPLGNDEIREITGLLGQYGQMPIRIRLLNKYELEKSQDTWTTQVPLSSEVILVDIPDIYGYFPNEKDCKQNIKDNVPDWIRTNFNTSSQEDILSNLVSFSPYI